MSCMVIITQDSIKENGSLERTFAAYKVYVKINHLIAMVTQHNSAVWPVPYACAQPYHPGSGSHGQLFCCKVLAIPRSRVV